MSIIGFSDYIFTSSDYGTTWTSVSSIGTEGWENIGMSATGQYQTAVSTTGTYRSTDYGATWTSVNTYYAMDVTISGSGQYQVIAYKTSSSSSYYYIGVSTNYGLTFTTKSTSFSYISGLSISGNGTYMAAIGSGRSGWFLTLYYYYSNSNGSSWVNKNTLDYDSNDTAFSSDGRIQEYTYGRTATSLYKSIDYGNSFTPISTSGSGIFNGLSICASGKHQLTVRDHHPCISSNYGETWTTLTNISLSYGYYSNVQVNKYDPTYL